MSKTGAADPTPPASRVERSRQAARTTYDRLSGWYDLLAGSEQTFNSRGLAMLGVRHDERVLEIGSGTGHTVAALSRHARLVAGVDLSYGMARAARRRLRQQGLQSDVLLGLADGTRLPFASGCFDAVFSAFTLELFDTPEIPVVLQEIWRVLRVGGRIGLVALSLPERASVMVRVYEWFHRMLPAYVDCRPIPAAGLVRQNGFTIRQRELGSMWGLPVEIIVGDKMASSL